MDLVRRGWEQFFEELWQLHLKTQWISVEDELPEELGWYLIYGASHNASYWYDVCYWDGNRWWRNVYNITHWMPIPQPPRGIRGNQRKISPNQQQIIGTPEHIKTALDVMGKKGGEK